jgi:hypothetical protein
MSWNQAIVDMLNEMEKEAHSSKLIAHRKYKNKAHNVQLKANCY